MFKFVKVQGFWGQGFGFWILRVSGFVGLRHFYGLGSLGALSCQSYGYRVWSFLVLGFYGYFFRVRALWV